MAKKENIKFKKRIKAQILQELSQVETSNKSLPKPVIRETPKINTIAANISGEIKVETPITANDKPAKLVQADLKKSAIIIGSILIIIIGIFIADSKTGFLIKISQPLFTLLHLRT